MRRIVKNFIPVLSGLLLSIHLQVQSQVTTPGNPIFHPTTDTTRVLEYTYTLTRELKEKLAIEKSDFKNDIFAVSFEVSLTPEEDGIWIDVPQVRKKIWLLKIKAEHAVSLNIILNPFRLNEGTKLFIYDSLQQQVIGAITYRNNKTYDILPVSQIKGNTLYLEMQVPYYVSNYGFMTISHIGAEPEDLTHLKDTKDQWYKGSAVCNMNIACIDRGDVQNQKNAVCRIIYNSTGRCTGTLLNNLKNDGTEYVLTAAHCFNTQFVANTAVFYFNYESPVCEDTDGPIKSVSGATIVAAGNHIPYNYDTLDFMLLRLNEEIPKSYLPYYSGWDARGSVPDSTYSIHHPQGDIKKFSRDDDHPFIGSAGRQYDENTHWFVEDYETGTTENGSSGCGLIDENDRLIGVLTSGGSACTSPIYDYYQMFSHCYNDYENPWYQLKHWLDPDNTGKLVCDGFDVAGIYRSIADKISNYDSSPEVVTSRQQSGWGYISGHNSNLNTFFAEKFTIKGSKYLYGAYIHPEIVFTNSVSGKITFTVWNGDLTPDKVLYQKSIALSDMEEDSYYIDFDSTIFVSRNFFAGYEILYNSDTFAVSIYPANETTNTAFTYLNGWQPLQDVQENVYSHLAIDMLAFDLMPKKGVRPDTNDWSDVYIYPNPAYDQVQVFFKDKVSGTVTINLYDVSGRLLSRQINHEPDLNIPVKLDMKPGIYFLQVLINDKKTKTFELFVK